MIGSSVRWDISLPDGTVDGVFLPVDDDQVVGIDDPQEVRELVQLALGEVDDAADRGGDVSWPDVRVETASGEHVVVRILQRRAG